MAKGEVEVHKSKGYTWMSNRHFHEKKMSFKAKGILSFMFSVVELTEQGKWDHSISGLAQISSEGKKAVRTALQELEKFGYLYREILYPEKNKRNSIKYCYHVFETPEECKAFKILKGVEKEHKGQNNNKSKSVQKVHTPNGNADVKPFEIEEVSSDTKMGMLPKRNKNASNNDVNESIESVQKVRLPKVHTPKEYAPEEYADEVHTQKDTQINTKESNTNELNTNISNTHNHHHQDITYIKDKLMGQLGYDSYVNSNSNSIEKNLYKRIFDLILNVMMMDSNKTLSINNMQVPVKEVQDVFMELNPSNILDVIDKFRFTTGTITNTRAYLIAMLYNSYFMNDLEVDRDYNTTYQDFSSIE